MIHVKDIQKFSRNLNVLYVEDNVKVQEETSALFNLIFSNVDLACDGEEGLKKYNLERYDIVITDINMPKMNGIELISKIREINPEQKIIAISAHDEPDILINVMRKGVSSFILKPLNLDEMLSVLYPVCRDADTQNLNTELFQTLQEERKKLKKLVSQLASHLHTVEVKNEQIGELCAQQNGEDRSKMLDEYFARDEDEGDEKVLFISDDADELRDILHEIPDELALYVNDANMEHIRRTCGDIAKLSNIFYRYTPFLDPLAKHLEELALLMGQGDDFVSMFNTKPDQILSLFDAVCIDLGMYVTRFSKESMAMHNIHHIHQPTTMSIQQIMQIIAPSKSDEGNDIEFF